MLFPPSASFSRSSFHWTRSCSLFISPPPILSLVMVLRLPTSRLHAQMSLPVKRCPFFIDFYLKFTLCSRMGFSSPRGDVSSAARTTTPQCLARRVGRCSRPWLRRVDVRPALRRRSSPQRDIPSDVLICCFPRPGRRHRPYL